MKALDKYKFVLNNCRIIKRTGITGNKTKMQGPNAFLNPISVASNICAISMLEIKTSNKKGQRAPPVSNVGR